MAVVIDTSKQDDATDKKLAKLERKLKKVYRQAQKELNEQYDHYLNGWDEVVDGETIHHKGFTERKAEEFEAYQNGLYTDEQWKSWLQAQMVREKHIEALMDDMAARLTAANQFAATYINDDLPDVYSQNYNYTAFQIESESKITAFNVVPPAVVRRMVMNEEIDLPKPSVDIAKDRQWNKKKLQGALLQGILQGDSVWNIATRFEQVTNMNRSSAIRNARTTYTAYQNRGKQDVFDECQELGTELDKEWISTHDMRTRESHVRLDGVRVKNKEKFPNGLMYPGDHTGKPCEIYNCRCAMRAILPDINDDPRTANTVETYKEWLKQKEEAKKVKQAAKNPTAQYTEKAKIGGLAAYPKKYHQDILDMLDSADGRARKAWNTVCDDFHSITGAEYQRRTGHRASGAFYSYQVDAVYLNINKESKGDSISTPYQTVFHEYGHHMDYCLNRLYGDGNRKKGLTETYKNGLYGVTLKKEANKAIDDFAKANGYTDRATIEREFCKHIRSKYSFIARGDVSDMFEPVMKTCQYPFGAGHGRSYWYSRDNGKEGFAEMYSAMIANKESWDMINEFFPESVKVFEELLEVVN